MTVGDAQGPVSGPQVLRQAPGTGAMIPALAPKTSTGPVRARGAGRQRQRSPTPRKQDHGARHKARRRGHPRVTEREAGLLGGRGGLNRSAGPGEEEEEWRSSKQRGMAKAEQQKQVEQASRGSAEQGNYLHTTLPTAPGTKCQVTAPALPALIYPPPPGRAALYVPRRRAWALGLDPLWPYWALHLALAAVSVLVSNWLAAARSGPG